LYLYIFLYIIFYKYFVSFSLGKIRKHVENMFSRKAYAHRDFCGDVIQSMRKWNIWDDHNLSISKCIFLTPEMLSNFLDEAAQLLDEVNNDTCHCKITVFDKLVCR